MEKVKTIYDSTIIQMKQNKWIHYAILTIIGILLSIPLSQIQLRDTHDGSLHLLRLMGTVDTLQIGQIPPLINQNYCMGLGYSMNLFYPPLVTYLPLLIKLFTPTYAIALKIFAVICIIISGFTMYQFTYQVTKKRTIALLAGFFYMIAPYKLANVYKRFAIGEFTALVMLPLVWTGLYNLLKEDGKKHYYIAIGAIGLMLSHTITTLYTAIFCLLYLALDWKKLKEKEILKKCVINIGFILLITMLFWMPLLEAQQSAQYAILDDSIMRTTPEFTADNTIHFSQLWKDIGEENGTTFLIGIPTLLVLCCTVFVGKKVNKSYREMYLLYLIFAFVCLFMVSKLFPWRIMPEILCKLQYPWRMMSFFVFFISFICGVNLYVVISKIKKFSLLKLFFILLFMIVSIISSIHIILQFKAEDTSKDEKYEAYLLEHKKITHRQINRDYMPVKALYLQNSYVKEREDKTYILQGDAQMIEEVKQENLMTTLKVSRIQKDTILEFPYFYYPGYEVVMLTSDGIEKKLEAEESEHGYLSVKIAEELKEGNIRVQYVGTTITYISYTISIASLIGFIGYIIAQKKKEREEVK